MRAPVHRAARRPARGFNLVELLAVLAIAAIVLATGLPDMRAMLRQHQLGAVVNDLHGAIELTRAQAMARGSRVMLAAAGPGADDWTRGWVVFVDADGDLAPGAGDDIIARQGPVARGVTIQSAFTSGQAPLYIAYNSAGRSCSATSSVAARWGTLSVFQGDRTRRIKINMLGRARVCDPDQDGADCTGARDDS
jgi:type IV fimbrial biogenesis protein FimT